MAVYGTVADDAGGQCPLLLASVTFQATTDDLRRIARHLLSCAAEMEADRFVDGGRHLIDSDQQWAAGRVKCDVIVVPTKPGGT